jgi:hypothetical protein
MAVRGGLVDAVRCAVEIQRGMAEQNIDVPQVKRIEFRISPACRNPSSNREIFSASLWPADQPIYCGRPRDLATLSRFSGPT